MNIVVANGWMITGLCGALVGILGFSWYWFFKRPRFCVGVVCAPDRVFHERIYWLIESGAEQKRLCRVKNFAVEHLGDPESIAQACRKALASSVDICIAIGVKCSLELVRQARETNSKKSILFLGVVDPIKLGLLGGDASEKASATGVSVTGVMQEPPLDTLNPFTVLGALKPEMRSVLAVYADVPFPAGGVEYKTKVARKFCRESGVRFSCVGIDLTKDVIAQVEAKLDRQDVLIYFEGDRIAAYADELGRFASARGITMYANSIDGLREAALVSYVSPTPTAVAALAIVKAILVDKVRAQDIDPLVVENRREFVVNRQHCDKQGLSGIEKREAAMSGIGGRSYLG